jgi:hypothetical protein
MMSSTQQTRPRRYGFLMLATLAGACGTAASQNFALEVADANPLGIGNFVPTRMQLLEDTGGIESGIKGAFSAMVGLESTYDSNFFLTANNPESELSLNFTPSLTYNTDPEGGAIWTFSANYQPSFRAFLDNSDLNDIDQSGDVQLSYKGSRTAASLFARYNELSGTDRLTGNFTTGSVVTCGLAASREIAPRTSINSGISYAQSQFSTATDQGSNVLTAYFGGLWIATERTSVGSTLNYSRSESDNTGSRDAWALLAELRYRVGERIWLSASLGPEFASDSDSGDNTVSLRGIIQSRYVINERWSWISTFRTSTIPSPSDVGYIVNNYGLITSVEHQLLRATLIGGIEFNYSEYQEVGAVTVPRENEENLGLFLTYSRNFFLDRVSAYSTVRYNTNSGDTDWSQWQVSLGLNVPF